MSKVYIDTLPYQIFKKIKDKYPTHMILITPNDVATYGSAYKTVQEYATAMFRRDGFEVYRYAHDYESLEGSSPQLGLVFLANDSVIVPGYEVHGLVGHNIRPLAGGESKYSDG